LTALSSILYDARLFDYSFGAIAGRTAGLLSPHEGEADAVIFSSKQKGGGKRRKLSLSPIIF
jgi:hypothetical protein